MNINQGKIDKFIKDCSLEILSHNDLLSYGLNDSEITYLIDNDYLGYNNTSEYYYWE